MSKNRRMFFELLAPPFLATVWLLITSSKSETISGAILGFIPLLLFAYMFGIIPAILYTVAMELWFARSVWAALHRWPVSFPGSSGGIFVCRNRGITWIFVTAGLHSLFVDWSCCRIIGWIFCWPKPDSSL
jgi:hypothetical protein